MTTLSEAGKQIIDSNNHVTLQDTNISSSSTTKKKYVDYDLIFQFDLNDLLNFIFPEKLQHPLTNARLFIFGLYGPLDERGQLRSGKGGKHVIMEYELDQMCQQIEREDVIQIYMHRPRDMATLSTSEQDAIINQADNHLKKAKGKAMLPQMSRQEIIELFRDFPRDSEGKLNFHEVQIFLENLRRDRIKNFKLVFPKLTNKNKSFNDSQSMQSSYNPFKDNTMHATTLSLGSLESSTSIAESKYNKQKIVPGYIAPATMFQRNKGFNNADLVEETMKQLTKHGNKIIDIDGSASTAVISNVKLLREISPKFDNPYEGKRETWNSTATMKGTGLGSKVNAVNSSSTWKQKYTSY